MSNALHFAKVFGIFWATVMVAYIFVVYTWGFDISVAWPRPSRPPMWAGQLVFWLWPVVPAFLLAGLWEVIRFTAFRRN